MGKVFPLCRDAVGLFYGTVDWVTRWEALPLCRDVVGVIYSPSWLGHPLGDSYQSAEMQLVYYTATANWATRWGGEFYNPSRLVLWSTRWGVLTLSRGAVGVFYSRSRLGHSLGESYFPSEMHSVYLQSSWLSHLLGAVLLLCGDVICVFYTPNRLGHSFGELFPLCRNVVGLLYGHCQLGHSLSGVLLLCRDIVGEFYSPIN